jgi:hypothetical protein
VGVYGLNANLPNVQYPFDQALPAARDLWTLAGKLRSAQRTRGDKAEHARIDWCGPHHDTFERNLGDEGTDTETTAAALEKLANAIAVSWAQARGEQNRRNLARYAEDEKENQSGWEDVGEYFAGEDTYDPPPNPDPPSAPDFEETVAVLHPEFENRR